MPPLPPSPPSARFELIVLFEMVSEPAALRTPPPSARPPPVPAAPLPPTLPPAEPSAPPVPTAPSATLLMIRTDDSVTWPPEFKMPAPWAANPC